MANVSHSSLTGADLHEPKGIATAPANQIYLSNGLGSGNWVDAGSVITNSSWTTGDTKLTFQPSAPSGWILFTEGGTIGDGSSGATVRANPDTSTLYQLFWNTFSNTICPVTGGRGATAAADYAAHKPLQLPPMASRLLGVAGSGAGLTARTLGNPVGAETTTLVRSDLPNTVAAVTITDPGHSHGWTSSGNLFMSTGGATLGGSPNTAINGGTFNILPNTTGITASLNLNGNVTQTHPSIVPAATFLNLLIKL